MHKLSRRTVVLGMDFAILLATSSYQAFAQSPIPERYSATYAQTIAKAEQEGSVVIYANTENAAVASILADFKKAYPKINVDYIEIKAADLYSRISSEATTGALKADIV